MKIKPKAIQKAIRLLLPAALCVLSVFVCLFLYHSDNKYSSPGPQPMNGVLMMDESDLAEYPVVYLVNGWEFYHGRLLAPSDFEINPPLPDETIFIGQYGGFEYEGSALPHGSASYRLNILLPDKPRSYMLAMPEVYSAYRLYINGEEKLVMGEPEPSVYRSQTGNQTVTFDAAGRVDILLAVSDFSHVYSGMVYPPAFGLPGVVLKAQNSRLVFWSVLCAAALSVGMLALLIGIAGKKSVSALLYGLCCLFFVGYAGHPVTAAFGLTGEVLYAAEGFFYCAMLTVVMLLQKRISGLNRRWSMPFLLFGALACLCSLILPFVVKNESLPLMVGYSYLLDAYKWVAAVYLTAAAVWALFKNRVDSIPLLCGVLIFDVSLVMDRLLPMYEPIVTGWFPELAGFTLILCIGAAVGRDVAGQLIANVVLTRRAVEAERLMDVQRTYYPLLQEKIAEANTAKHDLRHHLLAISGYAESGDLDKLRSYLSRYGSTVPDSEPLLYSDNEVANLMAFYYKQLARKYQIHMYLDLDIPEEINISSSDLCVILSNLLENAVDACLRTDGERSVRLCATSMESALFIEMENTCVAVRDDAVGFLSFKAEGRKGYGLDSVRSVARQYGGDARFKYDADKRVFFSSIVIGLEGDKS